MPQNGGDQVWEGVLGSLFNCHMPFLKTFIVVSFCSGSQMWKDVLSVNINPFLSPTVVEEADLYQYHSFCPSSAPLLPAFQIAAFISRVLPSCLILCPSNTLWLPSWVGKAWLFKAGIHSCLSPCYLKDTSCPLLLTGRGLDLTISQRIARLGCSNPS